MRKFILLLATLLPLFVFEMNADEKEAKKIPLQVQSTGRLCRSLTEAPIEASYYGILSALHTMVLSDIGEVELIVTNCSTGENWSYCFDSATETMCFLGISGTSGYYEVTYLTEMDYIYSGTFIIE